MLERLKTDILILGSGGAGLFAALHAYQADPLLHITVATKGLLGKCGCTRMVQGGYNVALNPGDSVERHFMDTIEGGKWLPNQDMAWTLVSTAIERVRELENEVGCFFDRNPDGTLHGKAFAGQTFDRTVHKGDLTGIEIINRLMEQVWARPIRRLEEHRAVALIPARDGQSLSGVLLIDIRSGTFRFVEAKAVLLATGGGPTMYRYHTPSGDKSMDGLAMALRLGLPLRDMEMVQFHPTGLLAGPDTRMTGTVLEEGLRGAGGHLLNGDKRRFMEDYDPKLERATRDIVSRAIYAEMRAKRRLRLRPRRRPGRGCADRALLHGRPRLQGRHLDRAAGPVRGRRGLGRCTRCQPAGWQRRRQLDGVRRHCRRDDGRVDRRQPWPPRAGRASNRHRDGARASAVRAQARRRQCAA
jgi:fumarate reductase flavoprotein subunit